MNQTTISQGNYNIIKELSRTTGISADELVDIAILAMIDGAENGSIDHLINQADC
jgi:1-aminocyclopropane-1-carboxylate deaminase/D-cysteine desulfhydrase-like pyridoxal-dependent ACC family enzyme